MTTTTLNGEVPAGVAAPNGDSTTNRVMGHRGETTVPQRADIPTLDRMNDHGRRVALAYYEAGVLAGIELGRAQAEEEMAQLWRQAHAVVQHAAKQPTYADLADRRGEPHRAERQRQLLRQRGIAA